MEAALHRASGLSEGGGNHGHGGSEGSTLEEGGGVLLGIGGLGSAELLNGVITVKSQGSGGPGGAIKEVIVILPEGLGRAALEGVITSSSNIASD